MAFGVEATSGASANTATNTASIVGFTVTAAGLMLVAVTMGVNGPGDEAAVIASVGGTFNGGTLTQVGSSSITDGNFCATIWLRLNNPTAGTADIVITWTGGGAGVQVGLHAITFTDASLTLGAPSTNSASSTNPTVTVAASASGDIVVAAMVTDASGSTTTEANTLIFEVEDLAGDSDHNSQRKTATGANTAMSWTNASADFYAASGLAVSAAGAGGGTPLMAQASF